MSLERAADLGFMPDDADASIRLLQAYAAPPEAFALAMDVARFLNVPIADATRAIVVPRHMRRYGFGASGLDPLVDALRKVDGQAEAYATTLIGMFDVHRARRALRERAG